MRDDCGCGGPGRPSGASWASGIRRREQTGQAAREEEDDDEEQGACDERPDPAGLDAERSLDLWDEGLEPASEQRADEHRRAADDRGDQTIDRCREAEVLRGDQPHVVGPEHAVEAGDRSGGDEGGEPVATHVDPHGAGGELVLADRLECAAVARAALLANQ